MGGAESLVHTAHRTPGVAPSCDPPLGTSLDTQEPKMFTRKLGHFLGLVFVLAAVGGVGVAAGAHQASAAPSAAEVSILGITWE